MLVIFAVIIGGIIAGRLLSSWRLVFVSRMITVIIWLLLFLLGLEVGSDPAVVGGMATLGRTAFVIFACSVAGSICMSWLLWRCVRRGTASRPPAEGMPEQAGAVRFDRADVIRVLMRDEDMPDRTRVYAEPSHLFLEPAVVIPGVDHDGRVALAVEEDICHPLAHTGDVLVDPAGVQRLEDLLAAVHFAHFFFLEFRCLFGHIRPSLSLVSRP